METKNNRSQALRRASELLDAIKRFLEKQDFYTLATTVFYDDADCDGLCLLEDIKYWSDEYDGKKANLDRKNQIKARAAHTGSHIKRLMADVRYRRIGTNQECPLQGWDYKERVDGRRS
jgi:hypothetical protein